MIQPSVFQNNVTGGLTMVCMHLQQYIHSAYINAHNIDECCDKGFDPVALLALSLLLCSIVVVQIIECMCVLPDSRLFSSGDEDQEEVHGHSAWRQHRQAVVARAPRARRMDAQLGD